MTEFYKHVVLTRPSPEIESRFEVIEFPATTGRCKDCKHYEVKDHPYSPLPRGVVSGSCRHPKFLLGYLHNFADMVPDGLWIEEDEGWGWIVGPEFGCIHFEER